jgi:hypothetical protein
MPSFLLQTVIMLSVIKLNDITLIGMMLNIIMLGVKTPVKHTRLFQQDPMLASQVLDHQRPSGRQ